MTTVNSLHLLWYFRSLSTGIDKYRGISDSIMAEEVQTQPYDLTVQNYTIFKPISVSDPLRPDFFFILIFLVLKCASILLLLTLIKYLQLSLLGAQLLL